MEGPDTRPATGRERVVAAGGSRRAVVGFLVGLAAGAVLASAVPRDRTADRR